MTTSERLSYCRKTQGRAKGYRIQRKGSTFTGKLLTKAQKRYFRKFKVFSENFLKLLLISTISDLISRRIYISKEVYSSNSSIIVK